MQEEAEQKSRIDNSNLIAAVSNGMLDLCMRLLEGRERVLDCNGNNLVAIAAMNGHESTLWYVVSHQIDLHHKNFKGQIPVDVAEGKCKEYLQNRMLQENEGWVYHFLHGVLMIDRDNAEGWLCDIGLTYDSMKIFVAECANLSNRWAFQVYRGGHVLVKTPNTPNHFPAKMDPLDDSLRRLKAKFIRIGMTNFTNSQMIEALNSCSMDADKAADSLLNSVEVDEI